jgi:hypothetical protein
MAMAATPPTTPPAIAPTFDFFGGSGNGVDEPEEPVAEELVVEEVVEVVDEDAIEDTGGVEVLLVVANSLATSRSNLPKDYIRM